jgi:hypothetical protein
MASICRERFGGDAWPAHLRAWMADAVAFAEDAAANWQREQRWGNDPLEVLQSRVRFAMDSARTAPATPSLSGMAGLTEVIPPPVVPKGAVLFFADEAGRPTDARRSTMWCWSGGPRWYYTAQHPPPAGHPSG